MNNKTKKNLIGVAWPYVNGDLHPGHIAGCYLPADIFARYKRLLGEEVLMISGTDCFGTPITVQADKEGVTPREIVEKYSPRATKLIVDTYNTSFNSFTKTDTELHRQITQKFFLNLAKNGFIIKKSSDQYYSEVDKKFLPDRYVEGECIHCHAKEQKGDQCENCGRTLAVGDLIEPYAKLSKNPVTLKSTEHYFVDLSKFKESLKKYVASHQDDWRRWVWKESYAWVEELEERAITRDIDWGVEIPTEGIPEELKIEGAENKRFYVWFDAVIGYFSEGIKWAEANGISEEDFLNKFWNNQDEDLKHYLFVGKDNLFFHTLWWQALLIGQNNDWNNLELKLANNVPVNSFLNLENQKFSKSRGIYIDSTKLVEEFGLDSVRFYLSSIMPENADANWKWADFEATNNNELAANIGNFIHRTLTFYQSKLESKIVIPVSGTEHSEVEEDRNLAVLFDSVVKEKITKAFADYTKAIETCEFSKALNIVLLLSKYANKYFNDKEPWKQLKDDKSACEKTIYSCLQLVEALRILLNPFCPNASDRLSKTLGIKNLDSSEKSINQENIFEFKELKTEDCKLQTEFSPLFKKIEKEQIEKFPINPVK